MIDIRRTGPEVFSVTIHEDGGKTDHAVTLCDADHARLCGPEHSHEACIDAAFRFLLDREPKEAILARFDITVIARYFPEFERELPRYL